MKNIAVFCSSISAVAFQDCFQGIRECAIADNSNVFFFGTDRMAQEEGPYGDGEFNIFNASDFCEFDGAILLCNTFVEDSQQEAISRKLEAYGIPTVSLEGNHATMYNFRIDNRKAMYEMVHHFIQDHGFTRINFVSGPLTSLEAKERYAGYIDALRDYQIEFTDDQVYEGNFMPSSGRAAAEFFMDQDCPLPEAIVCANDYMAMGVIKYLYERGVKVGEQVAVSGFDNTLESRFMEPRMTTVSREDYKAGYAMCAKLIAGLEAEEMGKCRNLQTNVLKRESCGCVSREEFDEERFRKNYYLNSDARQFYLLETRRLFADMSDVKTLDAFKEKLVPYIKKIKCEDFYLCLSNEWEGIHAEQADEQSPMPEWKEDYITEGYGSGTFLAFSMASHAYRKNASFGIKDIVEGLRDKNLGRNCFVVSPLHFADRMFGYCVFSNSEFLFETPVSQSWIQNIGYVLETIRKENLIASLSRKLDSLWIYDNLTGLYNRYGFQKYATPVWLECMKKEKPVTLFSLDMDELKRVNDRFGHDVGDRFVKAVAGILKKRKRHGEVIMRIGGDEFVILTSELKEEDIPQYCESIYEDVSDYNRMHNIPVDITVTIGYHQVVPQTENGLDQAIETAGTKRYESKMEKER